MFDTALATLRGQEIIAAGQFLYNNGWSPATSSNYSARLNAEHIAITVSGRHKGQLCGEDIMVVDLDGTPVGSAHSPSAETLLHTVIYADKPEVGAVLHTHSVNATVLSRLHRGQTELVLEDYELQKAFSGVTTHEGQLCIPIFANTQNIAELAETTRHYLREHPNCPAYLIRGHGLYTWGRGMPECLRHIEAMEFLLRCELEMMRVTR